jgi:hypothetical protein
MTTRFIYEVGIETVYGNERIRAGTNMFYAIRLSDDKHESHMGQPIYGSTPSELAQNVKSEIKKEVEDDDFTWMATEVKITHQNRNIRQMNYKQYNVEFMNAMSFVPKS